MGRVNAQRVVCSEHKGADVERCSLALGNPVFVQQNKLANCVNGKIFINLRNTKPVVRPVHALHIFIRPI